MGRPNKAMPPHWEDLVDAQWNKNRSNALYLEKIIDLEHKQRIPHNTIHKIMLAKGYASEQKSKQKRRKPWIRYEQDHSLFSCTCGLAHKQSSCGHAGVRGVG